VDNLNLNLLFLPVLKIHNIGPRSQSANSDLKLSRVHLLAPAYVRSPSPPDPSKRTYIGQRMYMATARQGLNTYIHTYIHSFQYMEKKSASPTR
jgi:hypothetical protein